MTCRPNRWCCETEFYVGSNTVSKPRKVESAPCRHIWPRSPGCKSCLCLLYSIGDEQGKPIDAQSGCHARTV